MQLPQQPSPQQKRLQQSNCPEEIKKQTNLFMEENNNGKVNNSRIY